YVTGGAPVQGLNFNVQVADGFPNGGGTIDGPNITGVDLIGTALEPTIFFGNNTGSNASRSDQQVWAVSTTTSAGTVNASGLLAIVTISTVGWSPNSPSDPWTFALQNTQENASDFAGVPATITDGNITIVPEPPSALAVTSLLLVTAWWWRRKRDIV